MSTADRPFLSATELSEALRRREIGSLELLELYLGRVDRLNPSINAVVAQGRDAARARARQADRALARGERWGPLHGLPMTVKDCFEVTGMPTTSGAPELRDHVPSANATAVQRLLDAGAVVFGKTNLPLYAGDCQSYNDVYGTTCNPWDTERVPGGSSGGAAAALAAGLSPLELGSDIGGSIRTPAHFCGVYGHKPSHGLVPCRGHIPGPPGQLAEADLNVTGPLARTPEDLDLALGILAGPDGLEGRGWRLDLPQARHERLRDYRVAVWLDDETCPLSLDVRERLEAAADALAKAGVTVDAGARPAIDPGRSFRVYLRLLSSILGGGLPSHVYERVRAGAADLAPTDANPMTTMLKGMVLSHREWLEANEERCALRARWAEFFRQWDVLLCPVMPTTAFPHDHTPMQTRTIAIDGTLHPYWIQLFWAGLIGMAYLPSTAAPVGLAASGLPVGVQVVAGYLEDRTALRFAMLMQEVVGGFVAPPGFE